LRLNIQFNIPGITSYEELNIQLTRQELQPAHDKIRDILPSREPTERAPHPDAGRQRSGRGPRGDSAHVSFDVGSSYVGRPLWKTEYSGARRRPAGGTEYSIAGGPINRIEYSTKGRAARFPAIVTAGSAQSDSAFTTALKTRLSSILSALLNIQLVKYPLEPEYSVGTDRFYQVDPFKSKLNIQEKTHIKKLWIITQMLGGGVQTQPARCGDADSRASAWQRRKIKNESANFSNYVGSQDPCQGYRPS